MFTTWLAALHEMPFHEQVGLDTSQDGRFVVVGSKVAFISSSASC